MRIGYASTDFSRTYRDEEGHLTLGGAGWYRCGIPAKYLARRGHDTRVGTLVGNKKTGELMVREPNAEEDGEITVWGDFDVLVLQRWMLAELDDDIRRARALGQVIINDVDDWFWGIDPRNRASAATDPKRNALVNRDHYRKIVKASSLVTVSTPFLQEKLHALGVEAVVLENALDLEVWRRPIARSLSEQPVIGWVGATPWRSGDLETLRGMLRPFMTQHRLRFHHSGTVDPELGATPDAARDLLCLDPETEVTTLPMAPIIQYPSLFAPIDIGLVPLNDVAFNHAKSWVKGAEYAAAGIPFVAQSLPEQERLRSLGIGRTARRARDWKRELSQLLDPETWYTDRVTNREHAEKALDAADRVAAWEDVYSGALR